VTQYFATVPAHDFFWWCLGSGVVTAAAFIGCFVFLQRTRLMENMPTSRLRSAAQGYVELEGIARLMQGPPIIAPLTKTRCCWWRFKIEEERGSGKNRRWVTVESGTSDDCFELDDATGKCIVNPDGATVIPTQHRRWYGSSRSPDVAPAIGSGWLRSMFSKYRYTEELINQDHPLYALGSFRTQTGNPDAFDEQLDLKELLGKWKHDKKMMALFDTNKDGTVDAREWDAARRMAQRKVRDEHVQRAVDTPDMHLLAKPRDGRPFILSGVPQASLIRRYRLSSGALLSLAIIAAAVLLNALLARGLVA
jgi:E3 Ubiquitin ligase